MFAHTPACESRREYERNRSVACVDRRSSLSAGRASIGRMSPAALERFSDLTRTWFQGAFPSPTPAQEGAWEAIASGEDALVVAPTGSGKTLAAFLWALDRLATDPVPEERERLRVLYVSP